MAKKILLADDSVTIQKVISLTFAGEDYDLEIVGDGEAAISKIQEVKPDLIMADVSMPKKNGYEICEIVKNDPDLKHIPVMLLAGTFEPLNEEEARRVGSDDYMVKPFESQEIIDKVEDIFTRPTAVQPSVEEAGFEAAPPAPETKPPAPPEIWEAGDFIGTKEPAGKKGEELWDGAILEEPTNEGKAEEPLEKMEEEFMDLELSEEELEPIEEIEEVEEIKEGEEVIPAPETEFEVPEPKAEPDEAPETEPSITPEPSVQPPEELEEREFEIPQEPESAPQPEVESAAVPEPEPSITPEPAVQTTEEVAEKVKERLEEIVGQKVEEKMEEVLATKVPEIPAIPKEKVEEIVTQLARDIVEEVAWEVIPDIAEEFIKEEIKKAKEAISSIK